MKALFDRNWIVRGLTIAMVALAFAAAAPAPQAHAWTFKVIHNFCSLRACADGTDPGAGLLMDSAGNLYGTTEVTAYEALPNADHSKWKVKTLYKFCDGCGAGGTNPSGELIIDTAGNLYGTTSEGGPENEGTVFELLPNGDHTIRTLKLLHAFGRGDGNYPVAALSYDGSATGAPYDGVSTLYGTTEFGGSDTCGGGCGVVFSLSPAGGNWTESTVYQFCNLPGCRDGAFPEGPVLVQDGTLLVTTLDALKKYSHGTVLQLSGSSATILHVFCKMHRHCSDGDDPLGLTPDGSGALFGIGQGGGDHDKGCCGVVFKLVPNGADSQYTVLHDFCALRDCKDGAQPRSNVLIDAAGDLYGATNTGGGHNADTNNVGGGTVYKLTGTTLETLYAFCAQRECTDGEYPIGNLAMDSAGNIFGVTQGGGKYGHGVVFELTP